MLQTESSVFSICSIQRAQCVQHKMEELAIADGRSLQGISLRLQSSGRRKLWLIVSILKTDTDQLFPLTNCSQILIDTDQSLPNTIDGPVFAIPLNLPQGKLCHVHGSEVLGLCHGHAHVNNTHNCSGLQLCPTGNALIKLQSCSEC